MLDAPFAAVVDAKHRIGILIFRYTVIHVKIIIHQIDSVKHTVHRHKALTGCIVDAQYTAFTLGCDLVNIRAEACTVQHIKQFAAHAMPAFSKCFFISFLPSSPPMMPHTNAAINVTGHIHDGISFVTVSM